MPRLRSDVYGLRSRVYGPGKRAFTLIELLVVVAIIALLAALLLPSLKNARLQAKSVACKNLLRQIQIAALSYADTYKGRIVVSGYTGGGGTPWFNRVNPYLTGRGALEVGREMRCPVGPSREALGESYSGGWGTSDYGNWGFGHDNNSSGFHAELLADFDGAGTPAFLDWQAGACSNSLRAAPGNGDPTYRYYYLGMHGHFVPEDHRTIRRHPGEAVNVVYLDGHVEQFPRAYSHRELEPAAPASSDEIIPAPF